jgi:sulfur-oxidizing protein SoxY
MIKILSETTDQPLTRRNCMGRAIGFFCGTSLTLSLAQSKAWADEQAFQKVLREITSGAPLVEGGIELETPRLADNGHSAALRVYVPSPMSQSNYVQSIYLLSDRNPRPFVARFDFTTNNPKAEISTRVRLNGSQNVYALAHLSSGAWHVSSVPVEVTESACLDAS